MFHSFPRENHLKCLSKVVKTHSFPIFSGVFFLENDFLVVKPLVFLFFSLFFFPVFSYFL